MIQIDMPMPNCCDECFALDEQHDDYPHCLISGQPGNTFNTRDRRMPTCPLKAQEPRVLSLEEYKVIAEQSAENRVPVWLEWRGGQSRWAIPERAYCRYCVDWRCWTSRPDEETREATPWN